MVSPGTSTRTSTGASDGSVAGISATQVCERICYVETFLLFAV